MKKHEFSKIILASVMILFFAGAIFAAIIVVTEHYGLEALLTYLGAPTATAIGFYAWKARAENVVKISKDINKEVEKEAEKNAKKGISVNEETQKAIVGAVANALSNVLGGNNDIEG